MACELYASLSAEQQAWYASCADDESALRFQMDCDKQYFMEEVELALRAQGVADEVINALLYDAGDVVVGTC